MKKVLVIIGIVVVLFFVAKSVFFSPTTLVTDADTGKPVAGATITYQYENFATGCGEAKTATTSSRGRVSAPKSLFICAMSAEAPGYHINGSNQTNNILREIKIYPQINKDEPIEISRVFNENQGMDALTLLHNYVQDVSGEIKPDDSQDFIFTKIEPQVDPNPQSGYKDFEKGVVNIKFFGEGGVHAISDDPSNHTGGEYYFDMENLRVAPEYGYVKELDIIPLKTYVARLGDGEHYMKFHLFASQDFETKLNQVCVTAFFNSKPGRSLDFLNTSSTSKFCSDNSRAPEEYVKKITYMKLRNDFSSKFFVKAFDANSKVIYTSNGYGININYDSSYPTYGLEDIKYDYEFYFKIPTYEQFSSMFVQQKGGGVVRFDNAVFLHGDKKYKANFMLPVIYDGIIKNMSSVPDNIHSVKELCDRNFSGATGDPQQLKINYNYCITNSFGF